MKTLTSQAGRVAAQPRARDRSRWWRAPVGPEADVPAPEPRAPTALAAYPPRLILLGLLIPVAFGRWGSYISPAGGLVFLSDLLVGAGLVIAGLEALRVRRRVQVRGARSLPWLVGLIVAVCCIGIARAGSDALLVVRDLVPMVYLAFIPVAAWAVRTLGPGTAFLWTRRALAIHSIWMVPALLDVLPTVSAPLVGIPVFDTRLDFDMLLLGATIAAFALDHRARPGWRFTIIALSTVGLAVAGSRAGLLSALTLLLVVVLVARPFHASRRAPLWVGLVLVVLAPVIVLLPAFLAAPPSWARAVVRLIPSDDAAYGSALNTWDARVEAWWLLLDYTHQEPMRWWFGSGYGSSPVIDSGAIDHLSGDPSVRAAHSFLVTWIAYVGLVGAALLLAGIVTLFVLGVRNAARPSAPVALGLGLMTGILLAAIPGVIFESPFGYQTFVVACAFALLRPGDLHGRRGLEDPPREEPDPPDASSRWRTVTARAERSRARVDAGGRGHAWAGAAPAQERGSDER